MKKLLLGAATLLAASSFTWASIIFDNFNISLGHFGYAPAFSSTTSQLNAGASTTTWDSTAPDPMEGAGAVKIIATHSATASSSRIRFLSGGPPYNSANAGIPAANTTFTTTSGTDGYIGFYYRAVTTATGWQVAINLDGGTGATADMDGSTKVNANTDGLWHLVEWNLDSTTVWGAVTGIGGGHSGSVPNNTHSIDSLYFYNTTTVAAGNVSTFYVDFVAKSDSGSIAALVPEPSTLALALLGGFGLLVIRRRG